MDLDRFIPNRSATNFEFGRYLLQGGKKIDEVSSDYEKLLADALGMNQTRIFAFRNKPQAPLERIFSSSPSTARPAKKPREKIPFSIETERRLDAPDLADNYYLNLLDWSSSNVIAVALQNKVYLWDGNNHRISLLVTFNVEVTSVSWAPDGERIAIGLENSEVELWDPTAKRKVRTLKGGHRFRVGSLAWNKQILTTGGMDGRVVNNDVRVRDHIVERYSGHKREVCGLKWSDSGEQLASGGNDDLVYIWDRSLATRQLHRLEGHKAAVKALAWCPFQSNLLASGGGSGDHCIRFWNTETGACPKSVDTGSQVSSLLWSKTEKELVSSHGLGPNGSVQYHLTLWKYPYMKRMREVIGHTDRVLYTAQSPDGCTVVSAAGGADESLRFWNIFGTPEVAKPAPKVNLEPFVQISRIR